MSPLRKKKSGYPKECIIFAEKTDSESSCLLFEKEKRLSERMNYVCRKYALRPLGGAAEGQNIVKAFLRFFPSPSGRLGQNDKKGRLGQNDKKGRMGRNDEKNIFVKSD